jgi:L-fucose mutarotase/ribose pyranase (RbsD/FucU family)
MNPSADWEQILRERLRIFGHRNWIVIADSAYPAHSAGGIETIVTEGGVAAVLARVLGLLDTARHVTATVYIDRELRFVEEGDAPGVSEYRSALERQLGSRAWRELPHEEIIAKLNEAAHIFRVLIIKTGMAIPYTSVFLELGCEYWTPEAEGRLRAVLPGPST